MKKICSVFIAALLAVMLCVPAFAADCSHGYLPMDGVWGRHDCTLCPDFAYCNDRNGDLLCDGCGVTNPNGVPGICSTVSNLGSNCFYLFDGNQHWFFCMSCKKAYTATAAFGTDYPCGESCFFRLNYENPEILPGDSPYLPMLGLACPSVTSALEYGDFSSVLLSYDDTDHYFACMDCGIRAYSALMSGVAVPHDGDSCDLCEKFMGYGATLIPPASPSVLSSVSSIITSAIEWLSAFVLCIVSNPLLLVFVVCVFVGLGIGLVKRIIRL